MNRDKERSKLQIVSLCVLLAMALIFAALTGISRRYKGVSFEEMFLKVENQGAQTVYTGRKYDEDVTVICYEEDGSTVVDFSVGERYHYVGRVEHPEGTIPTEHGRDLPRIRILRNDVLLFSGGYDTEVGLFFSESGEWEPLFSMKAGYSNDPWYNYEFTAGNIFYFANEPALVARGSWAFYAAMVFVSLLFAVEIAFPEQLFYFKHALSVRDPEPSDFFWAMYNISCVVLPILVLIGYVMALRMIA